MLVSMMTMMMILMIVTANREKHMGLQYIVKCCGPLITSLSTNTQSASFSLHALKR